MKTLQDLKKEWNDRIIADCKPFDMEQSFSDMLDKCYSFKDIGGPFAFMSPSTVLKEVDPTFFRCGMCDYADGMRDEYVEFSNGDHYSVEDCKEIQKEIASELESEIEVLDMSVEEEEKEASALDDLLSEFKDLEPSDI